MRILLIALTILGLHAAEEEIELKDSYNQTVTIRALHLDQAHELDISQRYVVDISPLRQMVSLITLDLSCNEFESIYCLRSLSKLKILNISSCHNIKDIQNIAYLTSLNSINMQNLYQFLEGPIDYLRPLVKLHELDISFGHNLDDQDLAVLAALPKLGILNIQGCNGIHDGSVLEQSRSLRHLTVRSWDVIYIPKFSRIKVHKEG